MNAGKSIKVAMAKRDITQKDLAERMGVSRQYVSQMIGSEQIGIGTINKLAETFGMKVSEFLALGEE